MQLSQGIFDIIEDIPIQFLGDERGVFLSHVQIICYCRNKFIRPYCTSKQGSCYLREQSCFDGVEAVLPRRSFDLLESTRVSDQVSDLLWKCCICCCGYRIVHMLSFIITHHPLPLPFPPLHRHQLNCLFLFSSGCSLLVLPFHQDRRALFVQR